VGRRRYTEAQFRAAVADPATRTIADLCRALGIVPCGGNYEIVRRFAHGAGMDVDAVLAQRRTQDDDHGPLAVAHRDGRRVLVYEREALAGALRRARSLADVIRSLGGTPKASTYRRLGLSLEVHGLSTAHLPPRARRNRRRRPLEELLTAGAHVDNGQLRRRLLEEEHFEHRCRICGRATWLGEPIPLELDHINGDRTDNRRENLRMICPNCHAQTPTYRGRNIGRYRSPPTGG